ncbi:hypothetical protein NKH77_10440 [Streptomyces sp. M19]
MGVDGSCSALGALDWATDMARRRESPCGSCTPPVGAVRGRPGGGARGGPGGAGRSETVLAAAAERAGGGRPRCG